MRKLFESRGARRLLSLAVCAAMVLSLLPMPSFAAEGDGLCAHHTEHTAECGYVAAVAGQPCTHVCGDECYTVTKACTHVHEAACYGDGVLPAEGEEKTADACAHVCTEESGCVTKTNTCVHTTHEGCGYVEAVEGQPCGYDCTQCANTGWVEEDVNWYYLVDGVKQTGWQNGIPGWEGKWFYFDPATGVMQTDLQGSVPDYVDTWYYLDPATGAIQTGGVQGRSQSQGSTFNGSPAEVDANGNLLINVTNFPDRYFRSYVQSQLASGKDRLSPAEVAAVTRIKCMGQGISSLKGIEYFTALTELDCWYNQLTSLDVSKNTKLTYLDCNGNKLTSLDVSKNTALTGLVCGINQLTSLDVSSNPKLTNLDCRINQLTSLDVSKNTALTNLDCYNNQLTSLDVSKNTALTGLVCGINQLTSLVVSSLSALKNLYCENNALTSLDLSSNSVLVYSQIGNQTATGEYIQQGGKYLFDLGKLVGAGNLSRVSAVSGGSLDSTTGMVTLDAPVNGKATFKYNYNTQNGSMDVTMTLTAHTHSFDSSGNCACGLVKQVPYVDAKGNSLGTQVCTVITKDTTTLSAGWYVAQGNVTDDNDIAIRRRCNGDVNLILEDGCNLYIYGAIDVSEGNSLTIYAQSTGGNMGKLTVISGSSAYVDATDSGAGIGSSDLKNCGNITINGGIITTVGSDRGAGIGSGGRYGGGGSVTISGGIITTVGSDGGAGIGNGENTSGATFTTGTNGHLVIFANSISDKSSQSSWSGVVFEGGTIDVSGIDYDTTFIDGGAGKVYGNPALPFGLPIPKRSSLTLDMNGKSLTFTQGTGITLNSGSALTLSGPGSFPNGISVSGGTLGELLAEGWAFTQNGTMCSVSGVTTLSGATDLSRITVTITTQPADVTMTYGEAKSLSVTAEPVTSGDTVTYQWYLDGSALTGETQSTLSLSTLNVGTYQIYCAVTCGGFTVNSSTAKVTVGKAASSVTIPGDPGKIYDGQSVSMDGKYTITGTGKVEYKVKGAADSTYTTTAPKDAGNYTVRVTAEDANHTAAYATKDFTITSKTVSLTVTVKNKAFDDTTTAEIDTVNTNGIVAGDDVQVINGKPSFHQKTPGENLSATFTEFTLEGEDAGNYSITNPTPTGVTGSINPSDRYLDLTGNANFAGQTEVWVDGVAYPIQTEGNRRYAALPKTGDLLTGYTYKKGNSTAIHENYPTSMTVYRITRGTTGATLTRISAFDDLLRYSGCAIRVTGKRGIRMITSLTKDNKNALKGAGLAGYTLEEYGTVVQWADKLGGKDLTLSNGKSNYAYKRGKADPVFANSGNLTQYTNVLVWDSLTNTQLRQDIVMRPYIKLSKDGQTVTLYGGCVNRSIGYIAYQNRAVFKPGTAAYQYVWDIIHAVYGNQYNSEYQG